MTEVKSLCNLARHNSIGPEDPKRLPLFGDEAIGQTENQLPPNFVDSFTSFMNTYKGQRNQKGVLNVSGWTKSGWSEDKIAELVCAVELVGHVEKGNSINAPEELVEEEEIPESENFWDNLSGDGLVITGAAVVVVGVLAYALGRRSGARRARSKAPLGEIVKALREINKSITNGSGKRVVRLRVRRGTGTDKPLPIASIVRPVAKPNGAPPLQSAAPQSAPPLFVPPSSAAPLQPSSSTPPRGSLPPLPDLPGAPPKVALPITGNK